MSNIQEVKKEKLPRGSFDLQSIEVDECCIEKDFDAEILQEEKDNFLVKYCKKFRHFNFQENLIFERWSRKEAQKNNCKTNDLELDWNHVWYRHRRRSSLSIYCA